MKFIETSLKGAYLIEIKPQEDVRGYFARAYCQREFQAVGLETVWVQANLSRNRRRGILRGLHYQAPPFQEAKLILCLRGTIYDVIVDLREDSPTHLEWLDVELSQNNLLGMYVPKGFAHGFQTLEDDTELLYLMSEFYAPEAARGIRWDDPALAIPWPIPDPILSPRDQNLPLLEKLTA